MHREKVKVTCFRKIIRSDNLTFTNSAYSPPLQNINLYLFLTMSTLILAKPLASVFTRLAPRVAVVSCHPTTRRHSTVATQSKPQHLLTLADLSKEQIYDLLISSMHHKRDAKYTDKVPAQPLKGKSMAIMFSKRSTRTRVATESALAYLGRIIYNARFRFNSEQTGYEC